MPYLEVLPDQCPPGEASEEGLALAFRILPSGTPAIEHFHSYKLKGKPKPAGVDDCRYMSCSLFTTEISARKIASLPKMRSNYTHIAELTVPKGVGAVLVNNKTKHADFWPFDTFDPSVAVKQVVAL